MVEQKKEPPSTRRTAADGGVGHRTEKAPCPRGNLPQEGVLWNPKRKVVI